MLTFALLVLLPVGLLAQVDRFQEATDDFFSIIDSNNDTFIDQTEFTGHFMQFDHNNDGNINHHEFEQGFDHTMFGNNVHSTEVYNLFDLDGSGSISLADIVLAFHKFDSNGDNKISNMEFHMAMNIMFMIVVG